MTLKPKYKINDVLVYIYIKDNELEVGKMKVKAITIYESGIEYLGYDFIHYEEENLFNINDNINDRIHTLLENLTEE